MNMFFKKNGFSLIEIMLAVALLGLVLLVICGVFFKSLLGIKRGQTSGTATYIANRKIDEIKSIDLGKTQGISINELYQNIEGYDPPATDMGSYISWNTTSGITEKTITGREGTRGEYRFTINIKNYYEGTSPANNLKSVTVEVKWFDNLQEKEKILKIETLLARKAY